jgi:hypothetical protein
MTFLQELEHPIVLRAAEKDWLSGVWKQSFDNLINKIEIVGVCVYVARERKTNLHHTWHAYSLKPGRDFRKFRTPKKCPGFETKWKCFLYLGN